MIDEKTLAEKVSPETSDNYSENAKIEEMDAIREVIDREMMETSALLQKAREANDEQLIQQLRDKQKNLTDKRRDTWAGT